METTSQTKPFPADFWWGASTSAYQVEGGWDADGKGPSIVDTREHFPEGTSDYKVASDHYHRMREDVALMAELGLKAYRFSIAWTRVLPSGRGEVNQPGLDFYRDLVDELLANGIEPVVTLYHFDLPAALDDQGGWGNRATVVAFVEYARILFEALGEKVKYWLTINEQNMMVLHGDAVGSTGRSGQTDKKSIYQQNHHMFLAGARVTSLLHQMVPDAKIGPAPNIIAIYPATPDPDDVLAADNWDAVRNLMYLDVAVHGRYHPVAWRYLVDRGLEPAFEPEDEQVLRDGRPDFIAFNYYATHTVGASRGDATDLQSRAGDQQVVRGEVGLYRAVKNEHLRTNAWGWEIDPVGLRITLRRLHDRYRLPLLITENGIGAHDELVDGAVHDDYRIDFYRQHIEQLALAIGDGVHLMGYCPWSAIDLISTHSGVAKRYGFVYVDRNEFDLGTLARIRKDSFGWYREVIATNGKKLA
ncbi:MULTISPECIES: glycoside hydrolase family 1 protein [unclassified Luteococcus]|uniref:glycoside hydrolase family 1 protein n=1 Tax=unclassified Luteococcus TaxID=2639923 RepID=UPI00313E358F